MPDAEITRAETRERARLLLVRSYDVDWRSRKAWTLHDSQTVCF
jgi:hypothetical protein